MRMMALCMALAVSTALSTGAIAVAELPAAEQAAVFKAAGFTRHGAQWRSDCDDPGTPSYSPGQIDQVRDINGDGRLEVVITEGGTYCYGMTGSAFWIVSQQADGRWRLITSSIGIPAFLATRGACGWPDIEVGGPGFCFPVQRWNGKAYVLNRHEYEGKRCRISR